MNIKNMELLFVILVFECIIAQQISELKCTETSTLDTDPASKYPFLMEIVEILRNGSLRNLQCYGTLISEDFVVTSSFCMGYTLTVSLVVQKSRMRGENYNNSQLFSIKRVIPFESLDDEDIHIALIQLNELVPYHNPSSIFRPACLWTDVSFPTSERYASYGSEYVKTTDGIRNTLKRIFPLTVKQDVECIAKLHNNGNNTLQPSGICLEFSGEGLEINAWGSPIHAKIQNQNYIFGIITDSLISLYYKKTVGTKINSYISWIESHVWPNETNVEHFGCGERKVKHKPLVTYGLPTYHGEFPWHVALYRKEGNRRSSDQIYICGGTIVSKRIILTAAHCLKSEYGVVPTRRLVVVTGIHNLTRYTLDSRNYTVERVIIHDDYNREYLENDIALIKLRNSIIFSNYVQPICLSNGTDIEDLKFGTVAGWGVDQHNQASDILLQAILPIRTYADCRQSNRDFFHTYLNNKNYCAGFQNGTNVCSGDSGGSMIFQNQTQWYIRGIVSMGVALVGSNRCDVTQLVLFTDVPKFYDWIVSNLEDE